MKKFRKPDPRGGRPMGGPRPQQRPASAAPKGRPVVGIHAVKELLKVRPREVSQLWLRDKYQDHPELSEIFDTAKRQNVRVQTQSPGALDKFASVNQGVVAFANADPEADWTAIEKSERAILIALDEVEDPHNLGAILRTAWLFGAQAILTPGHRAAHLSAAVSKVAQGAAEHVPVVRENALGERLKQLKDSGFWILGLSHEAKQDLFSLEVPDKVVWVLGSESSGLRKSVAGACDDLISIPQAAPEASYNVSVAAAIAVAETFRQHQRQSRGHMDPR